MQSGKIYKAIVSGDVNGDGEADFKDMTKINSHRLKKGSPLQGEYLQAADVTGDATVDFKDLVKINKFRLGKTAQL